MMRTLKFAVRVASCLALIALTLEVCARTEDKLRSGAPLFGNYSMDYLYWYDELGKSGRPNSTYRKWHLNEAGYRGPALRQGTYRIACIGASETFGLYESPENEWPRQLERMLNAHSRTDRFETVNVAYPGMSIGTSLLRLPKMMSAVHPQVVVIYPSYTSYIEWSKPLPWPQERMLNPRPVPEPATVPTSVDWRLADRLNTFSKTNVPESVQEWIRGLQVSRAARSTAAMDRLPEGNVRAFDTDLTRMVTELQGQGVGVILVTHANRFGRTVRPEDAPLLTAWRKFYPTMQEPGLLDMEERMSAVMRQVGKEHGAPVVDAANLIAPGRRNFAEFVHFTDAGASTLAGLVAGEIEQESLPGLAAEPGGLVRTGMHPVVR